MHRRGCLLAAGSGIAAITGYLGDFTPRGLFSGTGKLVVEYTGDKEPEKRRTVSITVGTYSPDTYLRSGTTPPDWNDDVLFQERYRLAPGETVSPEIFVGDPGTYRLDVWIQDRGSIGSQIQITKSGALANTHRVSITANGIESSTE